MRTSPKPEHPLLMLRHLDTITALILALATAALFLLVGLDATRPGVQGVDDAARTAMIGSRAGWLTAFARALDLLGSIWVVLPARVLVAVFLAVRRRWWHLAAFAGAMVLAEIAVGPLKALYDRPRPPGSLVATSGASFPSGHAVAASSTVLASVIALFPPAAIHRWLWGAAAVGFSFLMALSRAYLSAHWLSDAVAGTLLGATVSLGAALVVEGIRHPAAEERPGPAP